MTQTPEPGRLDNSPVQADEQPREASRSQLHRFFGGALLGLLGVGVVLRLPAVEARVLQPWAEFLARLTATNLQWMGQEVAVRGEVVSSGALSLRVSEECSGLEVIGIYWALTAVYPVRWWWRLVGLLWGLLLFQSLNFLRILGLFLLKDRSLFDLLHTYVWPLLLVGVGYANWCVWAAWVNTNTFHSVRQSVSQFPWTRAVLCVVTLGLLMLLRAVVLDSPPLHGFAHAVSRGAAELLCWLNTPTRATGPVVTSGSVAIAVGAGCAASPTLIVALTALLVLPLSLRIRGLGLLMLLPVFYALNVLRVVGVIEALLHWPSVWRWVEDYFLLSSLIIATIFSLGWRHTRTIEPTDKPQFWLRLGIGLAGSMSAWVFVGDPYERFLLWIYQWIVTTLGVSVTESLPHNPERVLTVLPVFQNILFLTIAVGWGWSVRRILVGGVVLYGSQLFCLLSVLVLYQGFGLAVHHYFLRGWIIAIPSLLTLGVPPAHRRISYREERVIVAD